MGGRAAYRLPRFDHSAVVLESEDVFKLVTEVEFLECLVGLFGNGPQIVGRRELLLNSGDFSALLALLRLELSDLLGL